MTVLDSPRPVGRTVPEIARRVRSPRGTGTISTSAVSRWITVGVCLRDGKSRLRLAAVRSPGGWLVTDDALEQFLARLTADRLGQPAPVAGTADEI
jgi:hypothetical protein